MQLIAAIAALSQFVMSILVGVRLILLARRTRRLPEFALGTAQVGGSGVGYPLLVISYLLSSSGLPGATPLLVLSMLVIAFSIWMFFLFTWRVFRPDARWAAIFSIAGILVLLASGSGAMIAIARAGGITQAVHADETMILVFNITAGTGYFWSAIESFSYYGKLRKRIALGLGDAVVRNRFLLWAVLGFGLGATMAASTVLVAVGANPVSSAAGVAAFGLTGFIVAACLYLTFLPPTVYTDWLRSKTADVDRASPQSS